MRVTYESTAAWLMRRKYIPWAVLVFLWGGWILAIVLGETRMPIKPPVSSYWNWQLTWGQQTLNVTISSQDPAPPTAIDFGWGNGAWDFTGQVVSMDHIAFYSPAKLINEGQEKQIYNHEFLGPYQSELFPPGIFEGKLEAYRNPPFYALFHSFTARLPYRVSVWIWNGLSFLGLFVGLWMLKPGRLGAACFWSMAFYPTFAVLSYGQTSLVSFPVFVIVYRLILAERKFLAGLVAALLLFKPPLLMGFFVWWALDFKNYWRAWLGGFVGGWLLLGFSYPIVPDAWHAFVAQLAENVRFDNFEWWKSHNVRALWRLILTPTLAPAPAILWGVSAILSIAAYAAIWKRHRANVPLLFATSIALTLWASPHTMVYEWVAILISAVLFWRELPEHRSKLTVLYAITWGALFISTDFGALQYSFWKDHYGWENFPIIQLSMVAFFLTSVGLFRILMNHPQLPTETRS
jgi:alpha-1,2-mannosyltransferase